MSEAGAYRCPSCGAPADPKAPACAFCKAELHPVRCPWCFDWLDAGARDCPRCGASAAAPAAGAKPLACPTCRGRALSTRGLQGAFLSSCAVCGGLWADSASFKKLCEDRATQAAYMGEGSALPAPKPSDPSAAGVHYRPCAACGEFMNRFNFAGCSGVILDVCKPHGVWFDADELRRIVAFIRAGGLDVAREKERQDVERERRRLESVAEGLRRGELPPVSFGTFEHLTAARGLLGFLDDLRDPP